MSACELRTIVIRELTDYRLCVRKLICRDQSVKVRIIAPLILLGLVFTPAGTFLSVFDNFRTMAQPVSDFPIEQSVWERTGPLIHYDWGLSAYIYLHNNNFYYLIAGGSEFYAIWISLDPNNSSGFQINGMAVDYVLSTIGPEDRTSSSGGLHKWDASTEKWEPIIIANMTEHDQSGVVNHSHDGSVAFSANQGKLDLAKIGDPARIWLVLEANEAEPIRVPQNGFAYLDTTNMFAAVFMVYKEMVPIAHPGAAFPPEPHSWVINRSETAHAEILLKNYGPKSIQNINASLNVPPEVNVLNGTLVWSTSIGTEQNTTHTIQINRTCFGTSILNTSLFYNVEETEAIGPITLQQKLTLVPRVDLDITAPQEALLWMQYYPINLTITNLDPVAVTVDLRRSALAYTQEHDIIAVTLDPSATITLHPSARITGSSIGYAVFFEDIKLNWETASVGFTYPNIWIRDVLIDNEPYNLGYAEMDVGQMHAVQGIIQNEENASYAVTVVLKEGSYSQELSSENIRFMPDHSQHAVDVPPNSNKTVAFHIFALDKPEISKYTTLSLAIEINQTFLRGTDVQIELVSQPESILTPEVILLILLMFLSGILAKIAYDVISRQRKINEKGATDGL